MDNALEACDKMEPQDRWIQIVIRQMGNASFIKVSNTCAQKPERIGEEFVSGNRERFMESGQRASVRSLKGMEGYRKRDTRRGSFL